MDPNVAWKNLCEKLQELSRNPEDKEAREKAAAYLMILYRWLRSGGFPPDVMKACAQMVAQEVLNNPIFKENAE